MLWRKIAGMSAALLAWWLTGMHDSARRLEENNGVPPTMNDNSSDGAAQFPLPGRRSAASLGTITAALASAGAAVRAGATVQNVFEQQAGHCFASSELTCNRILDALSHSASLDGEEHRHRAAHQIMWACTLSRKSGCGPIDALEAVRAECVRNTKADQARDAALATPRTTVILLAVLPLFTLAAGTLLSSHPLRFLLTTPAGLLCLCGGVFFQSCGILWIRVVIDRFVRRTSAAGVDRSTSASP